MNEQTGQGIKPGRAGKVLRPILIASAKTFADYPLFLRRLLVGFAEASMQPVLVCPRGCSADSFLSGSAEVVYHPVSEMPFTGHHNKKVLLERLGRFKGEVIHCLCQSQAGLTRQIARRLELPYVQTVNSLQRRWQHVSIDSKRCMAIVAPCESVAESIGEVYGEFKDRMRRVNMGVFVSAECNCFDDPAELSTIVTSYPLDRAGEFVNMLKAVKRLLLDYEFMLVVASEGKQEKQFRKLLRDMDMLARVVIVPREEPWRITLAAGDVFIRPRGLFEYDSFLLEAMGVGSAVAGCRSGVDDLLIDGRTCRLFDADDHLSIYQVLREFFSERDYARELAGRAQQYLREHNSVSKMVESYLEIYGEAVDSWDRSVKVAAE